MWYNFHDYVAGHGGRMTDRTTEAATGTPAHAWGMRGVVSFVQEGVWTVDPDALGFARRAGVSLLRFCSMTLGSFIRHPCGLHAAGLTYFAILAFVPVLCLLMVFAKTCGADDFARAKINEQIDAVITNLEEVADAAPAAASGASSEETVRRAATQELARQARAVSNGLFDRIDTFKVGTLGWVGFAMLMWTVVSTFSQVETSMNAIWEVSKVRPVWKRCVLYLAITLILPLLAALALSFPVLRVVKDVLDATLGATSYTKWVGDALVSVLMSRGFGFLVTFAFASMAFAFVLKVVPNRPVQTRAALEGGMLTAFLFGGLMKACTSAGVGIARSSALYGSFAAVPILLAWIYMSWQVVLLGSCMTYALQCLHCRVRALPRK